MPRHRIDRRFPNGNGGKRKERHGRAALRHLHLSFLLESPCSDTLRRGITLLWQGNFAYAPNRDTTPRAWKSVTPFRLSMDG